MSAEAATLKDEGNRLFVAKDYQGAIAKFTEAIALEPGNHIFYSNRSGAFLGANEADQAVSDAEKCVSLSPTWGKGYSRLGAALLAVHAKTQSAEDAGKAVSAFARGLAVDPTNASLTEGLLSAQRLASGQPPAPVNAPPTANAPAPAPAGPEYAAEIIGIDLGTTYSCVGVWLNDTVEIIANSEGARTTPSIVSFKDTERLVGQAAQAQAASNPSNTVFDAKRLIGRSIKDESVVSDMKKLPFKVVPGPDGETPLIEVEFRGEKKRFAPEEISAMVLGKMKTTAESYLGKAVNKAVITVPAYFNDAQRRATVSAGKIAGLDVKRIINEPTAAALAYGLDKKAAEEARAASGEVVEEEEEEVTPKGGKAGKGGKKVAKPTYVLIFDLGGGTFDVSLLTIEDGIFEVRATGGDTHLGGEDFDQRLMDFCMAEFTKKVKVEKTALSQDKRAMRRLRTACERAKRMLSSATQSAVEVESFFDGHDLAVTVTRAKFEALNADLFTKCIDTVKACMKDAKATPVEVGDIVLVGGSTRIPKVQTLLSEFFGGKALCNSVHPDEAVAYGAAVQGAILAGSRSAATQSIVLVDVTPLSLGIATEGGTFAPIIKRNTSIPVRKSKVFSTVDDYQDAIDVEVYEGERPMVEGNNRLGDFRITGIERAKRSEPQIEVTFDLDTNGVLTVSAQDLTTKVKANIQIANALGHLQPEDIERMTMEAMRMADQDKARMAVIEARMEVEQMVYYVKEAAMQRNSDRLKKVAEEATRWLEEGPGSEETCPVADFTGKKVELDKAMSIRDGPATR